DELHPVRIFAMDLKINGRVVNLAFGLRPANGFDAQGTAVIGIESPMSDVVVMTDPIHQRAAAECPIASPPSMMASPHIGKLGSWTAPQVVIKLGRGCGDGHISFRQLVSFGQTDLNAFDFAKVTIANELDGLAKDRIGALLRSDLNNCLPNRYFATKL